MSGLRFFKIAAFAVCMCLLGPGDGVAQTEDYVKWAQFRSFNLNPPSMSGPVVKFPLLLRLDSANATEVFTGARSGGADLRFRRMTSQVSYENWTDHQLSYQIAHWDSAARKAEIWVLMDSVYPDEGLNRATYPQGILLYWGRPDAPARSNAAAVFDSAHGFAGVWHMGGSSPTAARANAVPGGSPAVPSGSSVAAGFPLRAGAIGLADTLRGGTNSNAVARGADDHFNLGSGYADFSAGATLSLWLKPAAPSSTAWNVFMAFGNGAPGDNLTLGRMGGTQNLFGEVYNGTTGAGRTELNDAAQYNEWQHVTFAVRDSSQTLYHNGGQTSVARTADATIPNVTRNMAYLGRSIWADPNVAMAIDEVRLHKVRRSADWIRLDYETQKPGSAVLQKNYSPTAPALIAPAANAVDHPAFTTLSWGSADADRYRLQLSTDSLFTAPLMDTILSQTSHALGPLSGGTSYYWRVLAVYTSNGTSPWTATRAFTVSPQSSQAAAPELVYPQQFARDVPPNTPFSWKHASGATSYQLQIATAPDFSALVRNDSGITALSRIVALNVNQNYYWRVRGRNTQGPGPWSEIFTLATFLRTPQAPTLLAPNPYATDVPARSLTLTWTASPGATSYRVQVSRTPDFAGFVANDTTLDTSWTLGTLAGFTNHYWRVSASNSVGTSAYPTPRVFTTGEPVALLPQAFDLLSVSTLRVGDATVVRLSLPRAERVTVRWRDFRGRLSAPLRDELLPAGSHSLRVPGSPSGIGLLEIRIGRATRTLLTAP